MSQMVSKTSYEPEKNILINPNVAFTWDVEVSNEGVEAGKDGRKVIKAGTPIGGDQDALKVKNAVLKSTNTAELGENAQGILLHDIDVTDGNVNTVMVVAGVVDSSKCPTIDSTVVLPHIIFANGGAK